MVNWTEEEINHYYEEVDYDDGNGRMFKLKQIQEIQIKNLLKKRRIYEGYFHLIMYTVYNYMVKSLLETKKSKNLKPDTEKESKTQLSSYFARCAYCRTIDLDRKIKDRPTGSGYKTDFKDKRYYNCYDEETFRFGYDYLVEGMFNNTNYLYDWCEKCSNPCSDKEIRLCGNSILSGNKQTFSEESPKEQIINKKGEVIEQPCNIGVRYWHWINRSQWSTFNNELTKDVTEFLDEVEVYLGRDEREKLEHNVKSVKKKNSDYSLSEFSEDIIIKYFSKKYLLWIGKKKDKKDLALIIEYTGWRLFNHCLSTKK